MSQRIFHCFVTLLTVLILMLGIAPSASAQEPAADQGATSTEMPLYFLRSADCTDEVVEISGTVHTVNQTQADGSVIGHFNYQHVSGLGLTSGDTYQATAVDHVLLRAPLPSSITSVQSFLLISRGSSSNLVIHVIYHITVNENGEMTAFIEDLDMQCTQG